MNCPRCDTQMIQQTVSVCFCDMVPPTKIENVPADVCPRCGERLYSPRTLDRLEEIQDRFGHPDRRVAMDIFDFTPATGISIVSAWMMMANTASPAIPIVPGRAAAVT